MPQGYHAIFICVILLIIAWIIFCLVKEKRLTSQGALHSQVIYDGQCSFCRLSVEKLKNIDRHGVLELIDLHVCGDIENVHPDLTKELAISQIHLVEPDGTLYGGFRAFQRLSLMLPVLFLLIPIVYFPGMGIVGPFVYRSIARRRYFYHQDRCCKK